MAPRTGTKICAGCTARRGTGANTWDVDEVNVGMPAAGWLGSTWRCRTTTASMAAPVSI